MTNKQRKSLLLQDHSDIELLVDLSLFQSKSESRICFLTLHKNNLANTINILVNLSPKFILYKVTDSVWPLFAVKLISLNRIISVAKSAILINYSGRHLMRPWIILSVGLCHQFFSKLASPKEIFCILCMWLVHLLIAIVLYCKCLLTKHLINKK